MYIPPRFEEANVEVMHGLIRQHPLGTLVTIGHAGLDANHIPFVVDAHPAPYGTLRCHVARTNPVWQMLETSPNVLAIFQGPDAYISPSAYPSKRSDARVVPTWDYAVVHAAGTARVIHDRDWLLQQLEDLTQANESGRQEPWRLSDAPAEYIDKLLANIVGIEIPIAKLVGKWKMSQNRSAADRLGVVEDLRQRGAVRVADMVEATVRADEPVYS